MGIVRSGTSPNAQAVLADPAWLPGGIDPATGAITFFHLPRSLHGKISFLSREYLDGVAVAETALAREAVEAVRMPHAGAIHFIFHSAFCCSTLLTRALDHPGMSMGLKEPEILNQLATLKRQGRLSPQQLSLVVGLLARPFGPGEKMVVKPSNVANVLIEDIMRTSPASRALLLHAPLPGFLASIARRGLWGRSWSRKLFAVLRNGAPLDFGYSEAELFQQTDLQIAALAWLLQQAQFLAMLRVMPDRFRSLDSDSLLADRAAVLAGLAGFFDLNLAADACRTIVEGPAFAEHSKEVGRAYDTTARAADQQRARSDSSEEIGMVCEWAEVVGRHVGVPLSFPQESALIR